MGTEEQRKKMKGREEGSERQGWCYATLHSKASFCFIVVLHEQKFFPALIFIATRNVCSGIFSLGRTTQYTHCLFYPASKFYILVRNTLIFKGPYGQIIIQELLSFVEISHFSLL